MAKKRDIDIRRNKKKKEVPIWIMVTRTVISTTCLIGLLIAFAYIFVNRNTLVTDETLDLGIFVIPFSAYTIIIGCIVLLAIMCILTYFSILAVFEHIRRKKNPSALEKQIELIESQFREQEKKVFISSKEKMKQLEQEERERQKLLKEKYGDAIPDSELHVLRKKKKTKKKKNEQKKDT